MRVACSLAILLALTGSTFGFEKDVAKWIEVPRPEGDRLSPEYQVWSYSANYSKLEWRVYRDGGKVLAVPTSEPVDFEHPPFEARAGKFRGGYAFKHVPDGWLVGFNQGEFGAALYWFSDDGKKHRKISDHQVVEFFTIGSEIYAIEGLAHMGMSEGSIIRLSEKDGHWQAEAVQTLPQAPYAAAVFEDGDILLVLSDSLARYGNGKLAMLVPEADWGGLYPNSVILSDDEKSAYIGMRQFVVRYAFRNKDLEFLIPGKSALNRLPQDQEERIRKMYSQ